MNSSRQDDETALNQSLVYFYILKRSTKNNLIHVLNQTDREKGRNVLVLG